MQTIVFNVDNSCSAQLFIELAKKLKFKARLLSDTQKEDIAFLGMMEERKHEPAQPISKTYKLLKNRK